jgi:hypothetical protein
MHKNYVGIIRDHSMSMQPLRHNAAKDYNQLVGSIQRGASAGSFDTIVNVIECAHGRHAEVKLVVANSSVTALTELTNYVTEGGSTPLFESVGQMIETLKRAPDAENKDVAFLVSAITDGEENDPRYWTASRLNAEMNRLRATDRWTFTFRVPSGGYKRQLMNQFGIPEGNILEWETTNQGFERATVATASAMDNYYVGLQRGVRATSTFFADLSNVSASQLQGAMRDISGEVAVYVVKPDAQIRNAKGEIEIRPFVEKVTGKPFVKGSAFYQLVKSEKVVHANKLFAFKNKRTGAVFSSPIYNNDQARQLLGLPSNGNISLKPWDHGDFEIYVQSKSVNRHLPIDSHVLVWYNAPLA